MFENYLNLSFILSLQKKYNKNFSLFTKEIFVLPPIFKKMGNVHTLCFPVTKMLSKFNLNSSLSISRPIGAITIDKLGNTKVYPAQDYDIVLQNSSDFFKPYTYHLEKQETIKKSLELLSNSLSASFKKQKESAFNNYVLTLKKLLDDGYWSFYEDLKVNPFNPSTLPKQILDKLKSEHISNSNNYVKEIKKEISQFLRLDILPYVHNYSSFYKLKFFDKLGEFLRAQTFSLDKEQDLNNFKIGIVKLIAKLINKMEEISLQIDFLSKILVMANNALLVEQKKKRKIEKFDEDIYNYLSIYEDEIKNTSNEDKYKLDFLNQVYDNFKKDYNKKSGEKFSNLFFSYLYVFN